MHAPTTRHAIRPPAMDGPGDATAPEPPAAAYTGGCCDFGENWRCPRCHTEHCLDCGHSAVVDQPCRVCLRLLRAVLPVEVFDSMADAAQDAEIRHAETGEHHTVVAVAGGYVAAMELYASKGEVA